MDPRMLHRLRRAMDRELTDRQRELIVAYYEQKKTMTQLAREMGVNKSTVSRTLHRAEERLRRCLQYY